MNDPFIPKIVHYQFPPIIDQIAAVFPGAMTPGVVFSWGDTIFNPSGEEIHRSLIAHEMIHLTRQGLAPGSALARWWQDYLTDPAFRFEEEKLAHIAEFGWWRLHSSGRIRNLALDFIAGRLSGPLYGRMISRPQAETLLRKAL